MSQRFVGGFITKSSVPSSNTAAYGVWTLNQMSARSSVGNWPAIKTSNVTPSLEYLALAGGGGGGGWGAGGGAGGYITGTGYEITENVQIPIIVGAGGAGTATSTASGSNGNYSSLGNFYVFGGGKGAGMAADAYLGGNGGSGGGSYSTNTIYQGYGVTGQGFNGGLAGGQPAGAGGGAGGPASGSTPGPASASSITGSLVSRGKGGDSNVTPPPSSSAYSGNGGSSYWAYDGMAGGSGTVIIRYPSQYDDPKTVTGSYTRTVSSGYKIYTFLSSGSITF